MSFKFPDQEKKVVGVPVIELPYANPSSSGHAARLVLMSCYLYYWCDSPVLFDANYDMVVAFLVRRWDRLKPLRHYMLGSADEIKASGHHVRVSRAVEAGALEWYKAAKGDYPRSRPLEWRFNRRFELDLARLS